jgi:hypothetical protein
MTEPLTRSRLLFALAVSLLLHVLLTSGLRGFDHARAPIDRPLIRAALVAPPALPPPQALTPPAPEPEPPRPKRLPRPPAPKPQPATPPEPEPPAADSLPPATAVSEDIAVAEAPSDDASGDSPPIDRSIDEDAPPGSDEPAALTPLLAVVSEARLEFQVFRGDLNIGETRYHWVHDGSRYQIDQITETTGLAGLLKPLRVAQHSIGEITADGLKPLHYLSRATQGKAAEEEAVFDWSSNRVMLRTGSKRSEHELVAGAQDMVSLWLEIVWRAQSAGDFDFTVATGKRYGPRWFIPDQDVSSLDTAIGRLLVKRLQTRAQPGDNQIEIWLAPNLRWLPVQIRFTDRKGDVYDQRVRLIEYENQSLRAGAANTIPGATPEAHPSGGWNDPTPRYEPADEPANPFLR